MKKCFLILTVIASMFMPGCSAPQVKEQTEEKTAVFFVPGEEEKHEGTWIAWPHKYTYIDTYKSI